MTHRPAQYALIAGLPFRVAVAYFVLGITAFVAYGALWPQAPVLDGDSTQYLEVARDLGDGRIDEIHDRSPGYPLLIALTGSAGTPTRTLFYVSLLLHIASVWLLGAALHAAGTPARHVMFFGALLTLPPFVEPAGYVMTESLAQFMLAAGLSGLVMWFASRRIAWLVASSLAFAYAGLTRPVYQLLGVAIACGLILLPGLLPTLASSYRRMMATGVALVLGAVVILGGLSWHNKAAFGYFGVAPTFGFHLSTKTMGFVERLPDDYSVARDILVRERDALLTKPGGTHNGTQTIWHARGELSQATGLDTPRLSSYLVKMNLTLIRQSPLEYLEEVGRALVAYWFPPAGPLATLHSSVLRWSWALIHLAIVSMFFIQLMVAASLGVLRVMTRPTERRVLNVLGEGVSLVQTVAYVAAGTVVIYTMLLSCFLDIGEPRQRRPTDVLIVFMCVLGAHIWNVTRTRPSVVTPPL